MWYAGDIQSSDIYNPRNVYSYIIPAAICQTAQTGKVNVDFTIYCICKRNQHSL